MRQLLTIALAVVVFAVAAASAVAAANPSGTGQPSQTCLESQQTALEPGQSASAPGSAFNETGPGKAGTVYAGNGANTNTPANGAAVSQYDVACFQVTQAHS
jgi:hypothetical protein